MAKTMTQSSYVIYNRIHQSKTLKTIKMLCCRGRKSFFFRFHRFLLEMDTYRKTGFKKKKYVFLECVFYTHAGYIKT